MAIDEDRVGRRDTIACLECGYRNDEAYAFCDSCGASLEESGEQQQERTARLAGAQTGEIGWAAARPWRRRPAVLAALVLVSVVTVVTAVVVLRLSATADGRAEAADVAPLAVHTVSASSHLPPDGSVTYEPDLTVDVAPGTAWNDGVEGDPTGQWLEYTFAAPVTIDHIEVVNGYVKVYGDTDLFAANARVRQVRIATDGDSSATRLADTRSAQTVEGPFGPTCRVRLTVGSVYPGDTYDDVAVSDVVFHGTRDAGGTCDT